MYNFDQNFRMMQTFAMLMFALVFGIILFTVIKNLMQWNKNNHSPVLSVEAVVIDKRSETRIYHNTNNMGSSHTDYYVTFEFNSGDRIELEMDGSEYGMLIKGDHGDLTFQGTRYLGFERY